MQIAQFQLYSMPWREIRLTQDKTYILLIDDDGEMPVRKDLSDK